MVSMPAAMVMAVRFNRYPLGLWWPASMIMTHGRYCRFTSCPLTGTVGVAVDEAAVPLVDLDQADDGGVQSWAQVEQSRPFDDVQVAPRVGQSTHFLLGW